jgi:hypothetical protein
MLRYLNAKVLSSETKPFPIEITYRISPSVAPVDAMKKPPGAFRHLEVFRLTY